MIPLLFALLAPLTLAADGLDAEEGAGSEAEAEAEDGATPGEIRAALSWRRDDARWRSPTLVERDAVRTIARNLVLGPEGCTRRGLRRAEHHAAAIGFELRSLSIDGQTVIVLREGDEAFGAGLLAVRCGPAEAMVWQAPHPFFDYRTGQLVRRWFLETDARAAQWSTHHRFRGVPDELREDDMHPADVADEPGSLFQAATVGLFAGNPDLRFVQVHGFARSSAPDHEAVVSSGDARRPLREVGRRLEPVLGPTAIFGEVDLPLGGQQNAQGRVLPPGTFLHLEMSPGLRKALLKDAELRRRLARTIGDGPW